MTQEELQIISNRDTHWDEVIKLCRKYGFVTQEYGNSVTLMTNSYQLDDYSGPLAHPGRSLAQLDRASAHSTRSAVQPMLAADQHTC